MDKLKTIPKHKYVYVILISFILGLIAYITVDKLVIKTHEENYETTPIFIHDTIEPSKNFSFGSLSCPSKRIGANSWKINDNINEAGVMSSEWTDVDLCDPGSVVIAKKYTQHYNANRGRMGDWDAPHEIYIMSEPIYASIFGFCYEPGSKLFYTKRIHRYTRGNLSPPLYSGKYYYSQLEKPNVWVLTSAQSCSKMTVPAYRIPNTDDSFYIPGWYSSYDELQRGLACRDGHAQSFDLEYSGVIWSLADGIWLRPDNVGSIESVSGMIHAWLKTDSSPYNWDIEMFESGYQNVNMC